MSRLTKKDCYGHWYTNEKVNDRMQADEPYPHAYDGKPIDKLADYEDKEEQGLLISLPISAYFIMNGEVFEGWVQEAVYSICRKPLYDIRYDDSSLKSFRGYLGNEVFLTRSEAEETLAKLGGLHEDTD